MTIVKRNKRVDTHEKKGIPVIDGNEYRELFVTDLMTFGDLAKETERRTERTTDETKG